MDVKEKALEITKKTVEHLKAIEKLQKESLELYEENADEIDALRDNDAEFKFLLEEVERLTDVIGF